MHNPYDVMAKGLLEGTLSGPCEVRTEEEAVADAKAMDTVVVPDPARLAELPRTRDTLIARMMGAGDTLREAREDLHVLHEDEWEHRVVEPLLRLLRNDLPRMGIPEYTALENAMGIYQEALKAWEEERQTLRTEAMLAHGRAVLRMLLRNVGVTLSVDEEARIDACGDLDTLNRWILRASSARAANEVLADPDAW
jgi:hypothetical protein